VLQAVWCFVLRFTRTTNILSQDRAAIRRVFPPRTSATAPDGLRITQMIIYLVAALSGPSAQRHNRVWLSALMKYRVMGDFVKSALCGLYLNCMSFLKIKLSAKVLQ